MTHETAAQPQTTVTFAVEGMTCGNCVRHIDEALTGHFPGMAHAVDLPNKTLTVTFDPNKVTVAAIAAVMAEEGYPAAPI